MLFDLSGRRALVTGAGQGVGAGIAVALAAQGASVAVTDLHPERAEAVAGRITSAGGEAIALPLDVTDPTSVAGAVAAAGPVDILVNNAGIPEGAMSLTPFRSMEPAPDEMVMMRPQPRSHMSLTTAWQQCSTP